jgi:hypothetical protein
MNSSSSLRLKRTNCKKTLKGALTTCSHTSKGLVAFTLKKQKKEKTKIEKKKKILTKLIVKKEK